jgi:hypothetical protein
MKRFRLGQRVHVRQAVTTGDNVAVVEAPGRVDRLLHRDNGAWIQLDERCEAAGVHPFSKGDLRERDVLTYPHLCARIPNWKGKP